MRSKFQFGGTLAVFLSACFMVNAANAVPILCQDTAKNHMSIDNSTVSACLDAGTGNINGNPANDPFLTGGGTAAGYSLVSKDDATNTFNIQTTQSGSTGTWKIDASFWSTHSVGAIGFKFGTGNQPDEWFIYQLVQGVTSGNWDFINVFNRGGGLSHTNLYATNDPPVRVPEPSSLALMFLGLSSIGVAITRRRRSA